ncbi:hypothetical protein [Mycolicibacterium lacusdiani]|jgi:hypothetical protein|uniref:hypothetical protein n=1 Tax=Mycolicibacterium lacusdiani TaxID=2895283 RepID=UPI001F2FB829|nr:hypothetical protein [Mycolicibacterium lacusdiani]
MLGDAENNARVRGTKVPVGGAHAFGTPAEQLGSDAAERCQQQLIAGLELLMDRRSHNATLARSQRITAVGSPSALSPDFHCRFD